jgi:hypothetical protein
LIDYEIISSGPVIDVILQIAFQNSEKFILGAQNLLVTNFRSYLFFGCRHCSFSVGNIHLVFLLSPLKSLSSPFLALPDLAQDLLDDGRLCPEARISEFLGLILQIGLHHFL